MLSGETLFDYTNLVSPNDYKKWQSNFIISFISSFEINTANPFPVLTAPFPLIFFFKSIYFI